MKIKLLATLIAFFPLLANAIPVSWTLQDVLVGISGPPFLRSSLTGSFVYDADLDLYSDVNITSQTGFGLVCGDPTITPCPRFIPTQFLGVNYNLGLNQSPSATPSALIAIDVTRFDGTITGDPLLALRFAANLTNAGGVVGLGSGGAEFICPTEACQFNAQTSLFRPVIFADIPDAGGQVIAYFGRIVGTPIPEPQTLALLAVGLLFLISRRRYRVVR